MARRAATWAAGAAIVALAIVVGVVVSASERHQLSSNFIRPTSFVTDIPPGRQACQTAETIPAGAGAARFFVGTYGHAGPPLQVALRDGGGARLRGRIPGGWDQGPVDVPFERPALAGSGVRLCLRNRGTTRITVAGENKPYPLKARVAARVTRGRMRVEYAEPEPASWWSFAPHVADRIAAARNAAPGNLTLWLFAALAAGVLAGAVSLTLREAKR